ncbi:Lon protease C-terminal proteolytic domain-containing protein [Glomus cerebriforme]|uniref:Lon protease homolog, mitochondrial n=1 Tax=Glomus cerebriforme TaxID=658196 RepID=A0A397T2B7_9GLOM|nr:Lon protease C-terminal proteolytic domain-containing protein [Glomus cerebriforme]
MAYIRNCLQINFTGGAFARSPITFIKSTITLGSRKFSNQSSSYIPRSNLSKFLSHSVPHTSAYSNSPILLLLQPLRNETQYQRTFSCNTSQQFLFFTRSYSRGKSKSNESKLNSDGDNDSKENGSKGGGQQGEGGENSNGNNGDSSSNGNNGENPNNGNKGNGNKGNNGSNKNSGDGSGDGSAPRSPFEGIHRTLQVLETTLQKPSIPEVYPQVLAIPITRRPLFPGFYKAVVIKDPHVTASVKELMKRGQPYVGAFLLRDEEADVDIITDISQVYRVGVFAQITSVFPANGGQDENSLTAVLYPHRRIRIKELLPPLPSGVSEAEVVSDSVQQTAVEETTPPNLTSPRPKETQYATSFLEDYNVSLVNVENLNDESYNRKNQIVRAITSEIVAVFKDIATLNPLFRDQIANFSMSQSAGNVFEEPAKLADFAAAVSTGEPHELQEVLESLVIEERLQKALLVLKKELVNAQLQSKISKEVESKIAKRQREYYLMEQLKGIKKELGIESDGKDKLVEKFKEKADKLEMPEGVKKVFEEEINKLAHLEPAASEFNVTRNYLDWLTQVPWGLRSPENYNIKHAVKVLDEDHYGLQDVKDRILEFIAVGKLRGTVEGKILCFVGPPGVGKTSIGKSIARALSRQFYRFSVGGLTDVAEIKGHRRTYVGAMPGKVVQALKKVQTENPLVLIDEVDKIGRGHQGDPASALLELLDPEQNSSFLDHYMDVPIDLSKVLFVCTANVVDTIPGPLLDRMEVIQLSGYVADEKVAIASKYLAPTAKTMAGLQNADVNLQQDAIEVLIKSYCRESGVRNLKKHIDKIYRKAALKIVRDIGDEEFPSQELDNVETESETSESSKEKDESSITTEPRKPLEIPADVHMNISPENLKDYVGPPLWHSDRLYDVTPPGVAMGLAWTSMGGSALYIESTLESILTPTSSPSLSKTGQMGDVMKESSDIAYTFAKSLMVRSYPENKFFERAAIHLHVPEGATPKDGPSAGITMATSLLSLAFNKSLDPTIAMTGELTLTGKVLKIGGLREKAVAAKRSGVTTLIYPDANISDWEELPDNIKDGLNGIPVGWYDDVFKVVFKDITKEDAAKTWLEMIKLDSKVPKVDNKKENIGIFVDSEKEKVIDVARLLN